MDDAASVREACIIEETSMKSLIAGFPILVPASETADKSRRTRKTRTRKTRKTR
jgi:hypothetical protein